MTYERKGRGLTARKVIELLLMAGRNRILFITGRPHIQRETTFRWLTDTSCPIRAEAALLISKANYIRFPQLYMRTTGDRRQSHIVKEELLHQAIQDGYKPTLVFEDRADDTAMWRRNGLRCFQVAEGNY